MNLSDWVAIGIFCGTVIPMIAFSKRVRSILVAAFTHPLRTTYLDADGNDVTERVKAISASSQGPQPKEMQGA